MSNTDQRELNLEIQQLVMARLDTLPSDIHISVGADGKTFTKQELIDHVRNGDEIGKQFIEIDMQFLRALKDGLFYEQTVFNN